MNEVCETAQLQGMIDWMFLECLESVLMDLNMQSNNCFTQRDKQKQRNSILQICTLVDSDIITDNLLAEACQEQLKSFSHSTAFFECFRFFIFNSGIQKLLSKVDSRLSFHCSAICFVKF